MAVILACCCAKSSANSLTVVPDAEKAETRDSVIDTQLTENKYEKMTCPDDGEQISKKNANILLDQSLFSRLRGASAYVFYVIMLFLICSHNIITDAYYQNTYIKGRFKPVYDVSTGICIRI